MKQSPGLVIWFCGLPGSGKSTVSALVSKKLSRTSNNIVISISMDSIRKKIFPKPTYDDQERDAAYRSFVLVASYASKAGATVVLDGTGHRLSWRKLARNECPRFVEVYVKCPVEVCMERETHRRNNTAVRQRLYQAALARLKGGKKIRGLGKVPGIDEPFEESKSADIVLDSSLEKPEVLAQRVMKILTRKI